MKPTEIMTVILFFSAMIKIVVILVDPNSWKTVSKSIYSKGSVMVWTLCILAGIVLYYLLQELTIVQITGTILFVALVIGATFAAFDKEMVLLINKIGKYNILKKAWLPILFWLAITFWSIKEIFF